MPFRKDIGKAKQLLLELKSNRIKSSAGKILPFLFEMSHDLIMVMSDDYNIVMVSNSWSRLGWDPVDMENHHYHDFLHPDDIVETDSVFHGYVKETQVKSPSHFNRYKRKSGGYVWLKWEESPKETFSISGFAIGIANEVHDQSTIPALVDH